MKKIILLLIIIICFNGCSNRQLSSPKTNEWFSDKEAVIFRYERDYWKKLSSLRWFQKKFSDSKSFYVRCSGNGGMTKNFIELRFRVTPSNIKKYTQLHKIIISKDFYESNKSPVILASKLSPAERSILKEKLNKKLKEIKNKILLILPQLSETNFNCYIEQGYNYRDLLNKKYFMVLGINNFDSHMSLRRELANNMPSTEIILPKLGCSVYLYLSPNLKSNTRIIINLILDELSEFIHNDKN